MSDFLNKIKSVFIVEEKGENTPTEKAVTTPEQKTRTTEPIKEEAKGSVSEQFYDLLFGSLEKNNQEGFDYLEFKKSLNALSKLALDEQTRFQSAFAAAQSMGTTQQKLTSTASIYLKTLKDEESKFQEALNLQREKQIGDKEKNIATLQVNLKGKNDEIMKLSKQIEQDTVEVEKLKAEIAGSIASLDTKKNDFKASYNDLASQIELDIQKIGQYLK